MSPGRAVTPAGACGHRRVESTGASVAEGLADGLADRLADGLVDALSDALGDGDPLGESLGAEVSAGSGVGVALGLGESVESGAGLGGSALAPVSTGDGAARTSARPVSVGSDDAASVDDGLAVSVVDALSDGLDDELNEELASGLGEAGGVAEDSDGVGDGTTDGDALVRDDGVALAVADLEPDALADAVGDGLALDVGCTHRIASGAELSSRDGDAGSGVGASSDAHATPLLTVLMSSVRTTPSATTRDRRRAWRSHDRLSRCTVMANGSFTHAAALRSCVRSCEGMNARSPQSQGHSERVDDRGFRAKVSTNSHASRPSLKLTLRVPHGSAVLKQRTRGKPRIEGSRFRPLPSLSRVRGLARGEVVHE